MASLVNEGWSAREAAAETKARISGPVSRPTPEPLSEEAQAAVLAGLDRLIEAARCSTRPRRRTSSMTPSREPASSGSSTTG